MTIQSSITPDKFLTDREAFLSGKWNNTNLSSSNEPCGAVIINHQVNKNKKYTFDFYLSFGKSLKSALLIRITSYNVCYTKLLRKYCLSVNDPEPTELFWAVKEITWQLSPIILIILFVYGLFIQV